MSKSKLKKSSQSLIDSDQSSSKSSRTTRNKGHRSTRKKRLELQILVEGVDVTPSQLHVLSDYHVTRKDVRSSSHTDILLSRTDLVFGQSAMSTQPLSSISNTYTVRSFISILRAEDQDLETIIGKDISVHTEEEEVVVVDVPVKVEMPTRAYLTFVETPVFYLLDMPSITEEKNSETGQQVEKDNLRYDYLTIGKGRNRKMTHAEIQTNMNLLKTRFTHAKRFQKRNNETFASTWDMYDTYELQEQEPEPEQKPTTTNNTKEPEEQMIELISNPKFQISVTIMERILANNTFAHEQKRFRGLIAKDPFRPDVEFRYRLELLWTFKYKPVEGLAVTSMQWNSQNRDILAVGYGKFFYSEQKSGFVCCWNIKNPLQPEREYKFGTAVTIVAFSKFDPNLLAVGFYDGQVKVLDISDKRIRVLYTTTPNWLPSHEPIWQLTWMHPDEYHPMDEYLVCATQEGFVCRMIVSKANEFVAYPLMKAIRVESQMKGVQQPRLCTASEVPISKNAGALVIAPHGTDKDMYYLGTDEGTIHVCSRNYLNQHIDTFLAHNGPIYSCSFSPFCKKLFLTCGADWCTNIWAEGVFEPLITLTKSMIAVEGAVWSPVNCTIIATIAGNEILLWDLQRRTYLPASVHNSPTNCRNTIIQFTATGRNLLVGDLEGNVHIFSLEDMPFAPFYQAEMLTQIIKKALNTKTDLINKLYNTGFLKMNF